MNVVFIFSPVKVVDGDKAGVVYDGPVAHSGLDYQLDPSTVTFTFSGFESASNGISQYEWSIGSEPGVDDVMPYSSYGLVVEETGQPHIGKIHYQG